MKSLLPILSMFVLWPLAASWAQVAAPNETAVKMAHMRVMVRDVAAEKRTWVGLGGTPVQIDGIEAVKFPPGLLVFISRGAPSKHEGNVLDHISLFHKPGLGVLKKLAAQGVKVIIDVPTEPGDGNVVNTEGLRIDNNETEGQQEPILAGVIRFDLPAALQKEAIAWYGKAFGLQARGANGVAVPGLVRGLQFGIKAGNPRAPQPSKDYTMNGIGFEVANLEALCKKLEAMGIKLDSPYSKTRHKSFASAGLTDPWGASIELTEGLNRY